MPVQYAPPLTTSYPQDNELLEPVWEGPAYVRTRRSTRWHRVRSSYIGVTHYVMTGQTELRQFWHYWCGPGTGEYRAPIFTDELPAGEPSCGTCEGRAIGYDRDHPEWLFTPQRLDPPKVCPGSQRASLATEQPDSRTVYRCDVCGLLVAGRGFGGAYRWDYGPTIHEPGPDLIRGCPFHAWNHLTRTRDGAVACRCGGNR